MSYVVAQEHWGYELTREMWRRLRCRDCVVLVTDDEHLQLIDARSVAEVEVLLDAVVSRSEGMQSLD